MCVSLAVVDCLGAESRAVALGLCGAGVDDVRNGQSRAWSSSAASKPELCKLGMLACKCKTSYDSESELCE